MRFILIIMTYLAQWNNLGEAKQPCFKHILRPNLSVNSSLLQKQAFAVLTIPCITFKKLPLTFERTVTSHNLQFHAMLRLCLVYRYQSLKNECTVCSCISRSKALLQIVFFSIHKRKRILFVIWGNILPNMSWSEIPL